MSDEQYKLAFFIMLRNQIMGSPCPEEPRKMMIEKYTREHINKVARITMDKMVDMLNYEAVKKEFEEVSE